MYLGRRIFRREKVSNFCYSLTDSEKPLHFVASHWAGSLYLTVNYSGATDSISHESYHPEAAKSTWQSPQGQDLSTTKDLCLDILSPEKRREIRKKLIRSLAGKIVSNVVASEQFSQDCIRARYQYQCLSDKRSWRPSWRDIRNFLVQTTPTHGPRLEGVTRISFPTTSVQKFLCGVDDSIFEIGNSYDCTSKLASPESRHIYSNFVLSGSEIAINKTITHLKNLEPNITVERAEPTQNLIRYVQSQTMRQILPSHMVPQPTSWTPMNLFDYVDDITAYDPNYHQLRFRPFSSGKVTTHYCMTVMQLISQLIDDPLTQQMISRAALHRAMTYFCKQSRIDKVRELFINFEFLEIQKTPETFNILLWASAENEDLHNFLFILHMMHGANLIPNGKTWVAFLKAVPSREIKLQIYENMKEKGLLSSPTTLQRVVDQLIEINLQSCLFNNQDHNAFIKLMDEKYGPKWLSIEAANKALAVLGKYCLTYRTFEFLDYMESQFQYPDTCSINTILNSCIMKPSPWTVIVELMSAAKFRNLVKPGKETCRILFRLAWKTRSFNMAKMVWRYACLSASTSVGARKQINRSLRMGLSLSGDSVGVGVTWNRAAGLVILGSVSTPHPMEVLLPTAQHPLNSSTSLALRHRVNLPERFAKRIDLDLEISQEWRPSKPFGSMLWQAIERDSEWKKNQFQSEKNLTWLVENSEPLQVSGKSTCNGRILWN